MQAMIDEKWNLEGFVNQRNAEAGLRAGFVGIGQGGGKMVDAIASIKNPKTLKQVYPCIVVNSNLGDMDKVKNVPARLKFPLSGYERGVGKDPETGRQAFLDNGESIFEAISTEMGHCDVIFVVVSLGGGTGTGALNELVDAISRFLGKPVIALTSLPRPNEVESKNAYNCLAELVPKLNQVEEVDGQQFRLLESLIILDNEKIFNEHIEDPEVHGLTWDYYSNYKLAGLLHEWSVLTSLGSDYTVDAADLLNHILLGGVITFAKKKINLDEYKNQEDLIAEIVSTYRGQNVLANGFDYENDMRSMALVVVMPKDRENDINQDTLELIRSAMREELPNVNFYPGSVSYGSKKHAIVYTMANMGGLPERAKNLREEVQRLQLLREESESKASGFNIGKKIESGGSFTRKPIATGTNPFSKSSVQETNTKNPDKPFNPFGKTK
ncbi:cell division GTPase [Paenibacillus melissococcoides]|uniref:Cell division GTPase n=1 Tax=Paenibacillus melissococcoides TaxID=2912268 RepID=A0ABM9G955_9BACL|nr:tubulin-like doman-containing protein [Paenibacillus melissococcoides]CAH8248489.1 cell division GTPase [Paenibacillus melissococcoides]CAH8722078.1 cell division GTPase [Paenibacillus melissococcoides]CAH8722107.1 cell division GTPase [Paenibacillus melissococcoides]